MDLLQRHKSLRQEITNLENALEQIESYLLQYFTYSCPIESKTTFKFDEKGILIENNKNEFNQRSEFEFSFQGCYLKCEGQMNRQLTDFFINNINELKHRYNDLFPMLN